MVDPGSLNEFLRARIFDHSPLLHGIVEANSGALLRLASEQIRPEAAPFLRLLKERPAMSLRRAARFRRCLPLVVQDTVSADRQAALPLEHGGERRMDIDAWALDFRLPRHRLALLPVELVLRLARYFGLVRFRAEIAGLIRREDTVALRAEVGEEGHAFALRRTVLLPFPTEPSWSSASSSVEADVYSSLPSRIRRSGFTALAPALPMRPILCSDWPAAPQFLSLWKFWMRPAGAARPPALGPCCASCCARR